MIELRVLGPTVLRAGDVAVHSILAQPKRLAALAWLAIAGRQGLVRRDTMMALFWPELDEERARAALRQTLHMLRQSLGRDAVVTVGNTEVGLAPAVWCDAVELERAAAAGRAGEALGLYRGELLAGLHLREVPEFERWLDAERARVRGIAVRAADALAAGAAQEGRMADAIGARTRQLEIEPAGEGALRSLLRLLAEAGERSRALRVYDAWAAALRADLSLEPAVETAGLAAELRREATMAPGAGRAPSPRVAAAPAAAAAEAPPERPGGAAAGAPDRAAADSARHGDDGTATSGSSAGSVLLPQSGGAGRRRRLGLAVAALLVLALAGIALRWHAGAAPPLPVAEHRVLVLSFENRTGDAALDPVGAMAGDWIAQGLAHTGLVEVVSASDLVSAAAVEEAARAHAGSPRGLARATGASFVVSGAYYAQAGRLHFSAVIHDAEGRIVTAPPPVASPADEPLAGVELLRERAMAALAPYVHPRLRSWAPAMATPPSYDAYLAFVQGVSLHNQSRWKEAIEHHAQASSLAPDFVQAQVWAAKSWLNLADYRAADSIARLIAPRRDRLNFMDVLMLEWIEATVRGDNAGRLAAVRELSRRVPGAELVRYQLGYDLLRTGQPEEAVAALEGIDPDRGFMIGWPYYWIQYAAALHLSAEHGRELNAARQAVRRYPGSIRALALEAYALAATGDTAALRDVAHRIAAARPDGSDRPLAVLVNTALELTAHGHRDAARVLAARALESAAANQPDAVSADIAEAMLLAGRVAEARSLLQQLVRAEEADTRAWMLLGVAAAIDGDTAVAGAADRRLAAPAAGALPGVALYARARIAAALGDEDARALLGRAIAAGMPHGVLLHRALPGLEPRQLAGGS
jgi:DNA-binding SARP family transcriptional activator/thioredoxin-like negative regulator of GroEL